jgi:hypothetical protein
MANMNRLLVVVVLGMALGALVGCGDETVYVVQEDGGAPSDATTADDAATTCGPETYPCPPYGTVERTVIQNLTFSGWVDETDAHQPLQNAYRQWGLDYFYQLGRTTDARILYFNASAVWCSVCKVEQGFLVDYAATYRAKGVVFGEILFEDAAGGPATKDDVQTWATRYALPFTIGVDPTFKMGAYFDVAATPANFIISLKDQTLGGVAYKAMEIIQLDLGFDQTAVPAALDALTAE